MFPCAVHDLICQCLDIVRASPWIHYLAKPCLALQVELCIARYSGGEISGQSIRGSAHRLRPPPRAIEVARRPRRPLTSHHSPGHRRVMESCHCRLPICDSRFGTLCSYGHTSDEKRVLEHVYDTAVQVRYWTLSTRYSSLPQTLGPFRRFTVAPTRPFGLLPLCPFLPEDWRDGRLEECVRRL